MTSIELNQLQKRYTPQAAPAAADISLTVEAGMLLALLGPSGSGKSTILKLIAGIERPDRGDILFDGQSILPVAAHRRGAVLMFQKAYLFPFLSVGENIAFGLQMQGAPKATIDADVARMLDLVELPGIERRRPAHLSGGEQQRVALARALITRPRVLLLDEPFSSLDTAVRTTLQEAVRRIQRELGITTLLVTHDQGEAMAMADRVALLDGGALLAHAAPQRLFERPPTRRAARLMGVTTFLEGEVVDGRIATPLGALPAPTSAATGRALYGIRSERMLFCREPGPDALPAQVIGSTFRGEQSEYLVTVGTAQVRVRTFGATLFHPGDRLFLRLPAEHLIPLIDDDPAISKGDREPS